MITSSELAERVIEWGGLSVPPTDPALIMACEAVTAYLGRLPIVADPVIAKDPNPAVDLGAVMLAARIYQRRNTPNGLESFGEWGSSYVTRHDPDIARLLMLSFPVVF